EGDRVTVTTGEGAVTAPVAVVTAGAWVRDVLGDAAPAVTVTQEQVQHFRPRRELAAGELWPSFIHHRRPWIYGLVTPGEGVKVDEHHAGPVVDPAECLYTNTPDEAFVIERRGPVVVGSPCSGHGFKFTPLIGRRLAELATLAAPG